MKKIFFLICSLFIFSNSFASKITINIQSESLNGFPYQSQPIVLVKVQIQDKVENKIDKTYEFANIVEPPIGFETEPGGPIGFEIEPGKHVIITTKVGFKDKDGKKHFWPDPNVADSSNRIKIVQPLSDTTYKINVTLTNSNPVEGTIYFIQD